VKVTHISKICHYTCLQEPELNYPSLAPTS